MLRRSYLAAMLGLSLCCGHTASANAQQSDRPDTFYEYARNKIGLLRYCRDQALVGQVTADRAVKAIETALRRLTVSDKERGYQAEKAGEAGFWEEANGKQDLSSVANLLGTTTAGLCKELAAQTRTVRQPPVTRQVAPKVATSKQADLNADRSTTSIKPAAPPTVPTIAVISTPAARPPTASIEPANPPAAPTEAAASPAAARSASAVECEGNFQVQKNGNQIATPYCQDSYLAVIAREYGMRVSGKDIRQDYSEKQRACRLVGQDNRVRDACSQYHPFKRARR